MLLMSSCNKVIYGTPQVTSNNILHAKKYEGMAIRSLDRPQKEKQTSGSTGIPEKKSIPSTQPVSKPPEDDAIESNTIEIQTMDSSDIESTSKPVEDMHIKNQDLGESARKMEAKEAPISEAGGRLNTSSVSQQMQASPHSCIRGVSHPIQMPQNWIV
jgi:hypothetical protein